MWFDRNLDSITLTDLETLIRERVRENRSLDYKGEQPAPAQANNDKKSEFATDVASFANGVGGLLLYGLSEEREEGQTTGIPERSKGYVASC